LKLAADYEIGGITGFFENHKLIDLDLKLTGELDCAIELAHSHRVIVEIKSMKDTYFDKLKSEERHWNKQLHCYMRYTGSKKGISLVECKNTQKLKQFEVPWVHKTWDGIVEVCHAVNKAVVEGHPPPENRDECFNCDYRKTSCPVHNNIDKKQFDVSLERAREYRKKEFGSY
jgi:hypothetical protein